MSSTPLLRSVWPSLMPWCELSHAALAASVLRRAGTYDTVRLWLCWRVWSCLPAAQPARMRFPPARWISPASSAPRNRIRLWPRRPATRRSPIPSRLSTRYHRTNCLQSFRVWPDPTHNLQAGREQAYAGGGLGDTQPDIQFPRHHLGPGTTGRQRQQGASAVFPQRLWPQ
jgi:hypothetical protein